MNTHQHQNEETLHSRWSEIEQCRSCYYKRKTFSPRTNLPSSSPRAILFFGEWKHLLRLFNNMDSTQFASSHFSSTRSSQTTSKKLIQQERPPEHERVVAKSKPMWKFVSTTVDRSPTALGFECILTVRGHSQQKVQIWISQVQGNLYPEIRMRTQHRVFMWANLMWIRSPVHGKLAAETNNNPVGTRLSHHNGTISRNDVRHLEKVYSNVR